MFTQKELDEDGQKNEQEILSHFPLHAQRIRRGLWPQTLRRPSPSQGLAKLVLTLLETLRQLIDRQAMRRVSEGSLSESQVEHLGSMLSELHSKIREIASIFDIAEDDLRLDLGPMGELVDPSGATQFSARRSLTLVDVLDRLIDKGVLVQGDLGISLSDVELISVQLLLLISAVKRPKSKSTTSQKRILSPTRGKLSPDTTTRKIKKRMKVVGS
jgi:hypothetical protein